MFLGDIQSSGASLLLQFGVAMYRRIRTWLGLGEVVVAAWVHQLFFAVLMRRLGVHRTGGHDCARGKRVFLLSRVVSIVSKPDYRFS